MNNYTEKQIKLAGLIQPDGGAREFEQGLDLQGEGIRVLQNDRTIFEENTGDCCEDLQTCELAFNACEAERIVLEQENQDLQEENDSLTDIANGSPGNCGSVAYSYPSRALRYSGTVCVSGESGALSATINGTWESPTGGGGGGGTIGISGRFIDESYSIVGIPSLSLTWSVLWTDANYESESFSDDTTSTESIPANAIGIVWRGGDPTINVGYTFF